MENADLEPKETTEKLNKALETIKDPQSILNPVSQAEFRMTMRLLRAEVNWHHRLIANRAVEKISKKNKLIIFLLLLNLTGIGILIYLLI